MICTVGAIYPSDTISELRKKIVVTPLCIKLKISKWTSPCIFSPQGYIKVLCNYLTLSKYKSNIKVDYLKCMYNRVLFPGFSLAEQNIETDAGILRQ